MGTTEYTIEPGRQDVIVERRLDAPAELVFKAHTDPELIPQWWGPRGYRTEIEVMEPRPGGRWRWIHHDLEGNTHPFCGVYHDVVEGQRIVGTFEYEPAAGHVSLTTIDFISDGDGTRLVTRQVFQTVEDRDAMVAAGMKRGSDDSMDQLEELLVRLQQPVSSSGI